MILSVSNSLMCKSACEFSLNVLVSVFWARAHRGLYRHRVFHAVIACKFMYFAMKGGVIFSPENHFFCAIVCKSPENR